MVDGDILAFVDLDAVVSGYLGVGDVDIGHRHLGQTVEIEGAHGTLAGHVVDVDILELGCFLAHGLHVTFGDNALGGHLLLLFQGIGSRKSGVVQVEEDAVGRNIDHVYILDVNVLHHTATSAGRLEAQADIGAKEHAVPDAHVLHAARHLRTHHESAMSMIDGTSVHHDILARRLQVATVLVLARLDADGIVAHVKLVVDDQAVLAGFEVQAVAVLAIPGIDDHDVLDNDILAHERVQVPGGRVLEADALQPDVLAVGKVEEGWAKEVACLLPVLVGLTPGGYIHVAAAQFVEDGLGGCPNLRALGHACHTALFEQRVPLALRKLAMFDPSPGVTMSVDGSEARDGNVLLAVGIERADAAPGLQAFEVGIDNGIFAVVAREQDHRTLLQMQVDVVLEGDGAREPDATWHDEVTASALADAAHGKIEFFRVVIVPVSTCTVFGDALRKLIEDRSAHLCHLEGQSFRIKRQVVGRKLGRIEVFAAS